VNGKTPQQSNKDMTMKKRINSKAKGNAAERELAKILTERFGLPFARVGVSSGARPKQVKLDDGARETFTGDLITPQGFKFSIESKSANVDVDLLGQSALLDKFLQQAKDDAESIGKMPMLCWKRSRKGWITAVLFGAFRYDGNLPEYYARYREWLICRLDTLLEVADPRF